MTTAAPLLLAIRIPATAMVTWRLSGASRCGSWSPVAGHPRFVSSNGRMCSFARHGPTLRPRTALRALRTLVLRQPAGCEPQRLVDVRPRDTRHLDRHQPDGCPLAPGGVAVRQPTEQH